MNATNDERKAVSKLTFSANPATVRLKRLFLCFCLIYGANWWHLSPLRTLLLQFLNEFVEVEDDFLALGGDDALRVELDALK